MKDIKFDVLVVGAGFAGSVLARELADAGRKVHIIDKRPHIGGNAYDSYDDHGVLIHNYGPHIFHTNSERIMRWLSRFTDWRLYEHRVVAKVGNQFFPIPINQTTINQLYGLKLDETGVKDHLERVRINLGQINNSEDLVLSTVGHDLCDKFFRGYTQKQWGMDLSELSTTVAARIPTRTNTDDRYFSDDYQFMPNKGYTELFKNMLAHENITIELEADFCSIQKISDHRTLIYTGPIDEYYRFCFGKLPYRSLRFDHHHIPGVDFHQTTGTVNFPNDFEYTRTSEFKHLTGQKISGTSIVTEYPQDAGDPYYPIPQNKNEEIFLKYQKLAEKEEQTYFVGRLAQYKYYNMDQVVGAALSLAKKIINLKSDSI